MEGEKKSYIIDDESRKFFSSFADEHFGPTFNLEGFLEIIRQKPRKLFIDTMIFMIHPRVNKYAGRYIKSNRLDESISELRKEFGEVTGDFVDKLSEEERTDFYDYWFGKELFRTILLVFTFIINKNKQEPDSISEDVIKLISEKRIDEVFYKPILEIFQLLTSSGDIYEYYANSYVSDFEFLFGNYVEKINSRINSQSGHRQLRINNVISYNNGKYEKVFDAMDSALRNSLAHRSFYVDSENNRIKLENLERELDELSLSDLEDKAFKLKIITYMLITSEEYMLMNNNIAIDYLKAIAKEFIINPQNFIEIWSVMIDTICTKLDEDSKNRIYSIILRNFGTFIFNRFILILMKSLNMFGFTGFEFILTFAAHLYKPFLSDLTEKEEEELVQQLSICFGSVDIPDNRDFEMEIKKFIKIMILNFINVKPERAKFLTDLFDELNLL